MNERVFINNLTVSSSCSFRYYVRVETNKREGSDIMNELVPSLLYVRSDIMKTQIFYYTSTFYFLFAQIMCSCL